ncbi:hypothetical protein VP01_3707g1 [Puccinia sorghi]|uniref:Uncharacterized protein n=1 Tax=Puccinia sorghi TaxID=27349 RepID=A0A0L6UU40_9BASI|nr:hypothetical protein VP01_3707g1 [Puccinia sorghi]
MLWKVCEKTKYWHSAQLGHDQVGSSTSRSLSFPNLKQWKMATGRPKKTCMLGHNHRLEAGCLLFDTPRPNDRPDSDEQRMRDPSRSAVGLSYKQLLLPRGPCSTRCLSAARLNGLSAGSYSTTIDGSQMILDCPPDVSRVRVVVASRHLFGKLNLFFRCPGTMLYKGGLLLCHESAPTSQPCNRTPSLPKHTLAATRTQCCLPFTTSTRCSLSWSLGFSVSPKPGMGSPRTQAAAAAAVVVRSHEFLALGPAVPPTHCESSPYPYCSIPFSSLPYTPLATSPLMNSYYFPSLYHLHLIPVYMLLCSPGAFHSFILIVHRLNNDCCGHYQACFIAHIITTSASPFLFPIHEYIRTFSPAYLPGVIPIRKNTISTGFSRCASHLLSKNHLSRSEINSQRAGKTGQERFSALAEPVVELEASRRKFPYPIILGDNGPTPPAAGGVDQGISTSPVGGCSLL